VDFWQDDRFDPHISARASARYLRDLNANFGDWHLALAAYNWGEGSVSRAIARNQKAGLATDYLSLKMPNETQYYVPKLQAVKNIIARPEDFGLELPQVDNHPYFLSVAIRRDIDVDLAARLAGMRVDDFRALNPQMNKPVILAAGTPQVLLPYDNANQFVRRIDQHRGPMATWTAWVAPRTLKTTEVARLVGMPEPDLREVNRIPERMVVKAGSTLLVTRTAHAAADVSEHVADNASIALAPEARALRRTTVHASRRGDTVAALARRYGMPAAQLARLNGVAVAGRFAPGQSVQVESRSPIARAPGAAVASAARPAARAAARQVTHSKRPLRVAAAPARRVR
jgi:membrane-bound lytic murein transglycosylase D